MTKTKENLLVGAFLVMWGITTFLLYEEGRWDIVAKARRRSEALRDYCAHVPTATFCEGVE